MRSFLPTEEEIFDVKSREASREQLERLDKRRVNIYRCAYVLFSLALLVLVPVPLAGLLSYHLIDFFELAHKTDAVYFWQLDRMWLSWANLGVEVWPVSLLAVVVFTVLLFTLYSIIFSRFKKAQIRPLREIRPPVAGNGEHGTAREMNDAEKIDAGFIAWYPYKPLGKNAFADVCLPDIAGYRKPLSLPPDFGGVVGHEGEPGTKTECFHLSPPGHTTYFALSGEGKSRRCIKTTIHLKALRRESMAVMDEKEEHFLDCHETLRALGYDVFIVNLRDPAFSDGWNLLTRINEWYDEHENITFEQIEKESGKRVRQTWQARIGKEWEKNGEIITEALAEKIAVEELKALQQAAIDYCLTRCERAATELGRIISETYSSNSVANKDFWSSQAAGIITAGNMLNVECPNKDVRNMFNIVRFFDVLGEERTIRTKIKGTKNQHAESKISLISTIFSSLDPYHPSRGAYVAAKQAKGNTASSINTTALNSLKIFMNRDMQSLGNKSDFDMRKFGTKPTAVFIVPPHEEETYAPLFPIFIKQLYQTLIEVAREHGGRLPITFNFILEELGVIWKIPGLCTKYSMGRDYGVRFIAAAQDMAQINKYDEGRVGGQDEILGNSRTVVYMSSSNDKAHHFMSKRCGNYTIQVKDGGESKHKGTFNPLAGSVSTSTKLTGRPLYFPDEVGRINIDVDGVMVYRASRGIGMFPSQDLAKMSTNDFFSLPKPSKCSDTDDRRTKELRMQRRAKLSPKPFTRPKLWDVEGLVPLQYRDLVSQDANGVLMPDKVPAKAKGGDGASAKKKQSPGQMSFQELWNVVRSEATTQSEELTGVK